MFNFKNKIKHDWKPYGNAVALERDVPGEFPKKELFIFVIEHCAKTGMYRYVRVPSNKKLAALEAQDKEE